MIGNTGMTVADAEAVQIIDADSVVCSEAEVGEMSSGVIEIGRINTIKEGTFDELGDNIMGQYPGGGNSMMGGM